MFVGFVSFLVCLAWVLFRANSLSNAGLIFGKFAALPGELGGYLARLSQTYAVGVVRDMFQLGAEVARSIAGFGSTACVLSFTLIAVLVVSEVVTRRTDGMALLARMPLAARWA